MIRTADPPSVTRCFRGALPVLIIQFTGFCGHRLCLATGTCPYYLSIFPDGYQQSICARTNLKVNVDNLQPGQSVEVTLWTYPQDIDGDGATREVIFTQTGTSGPLTICVGPPEPGYTSAYVDVEIQGTAVTEGTDHIVEEGEIPENSQGGPCPTICNLGKEDNITFVLWGPQMDLILSHPSLGNIGLLSVNNDYDETASGNVRDKDVAGILLSPAPDDELAELTLSIRCPSDYEGTMKGRYRLRSNDAKLYDSSGNEITSEMLLPATGPIELEPGQTYDLGTDVYWVEAVQPSGTVGGSEAVLTWVPECCGGGCPSERLEFKINFTAFEVDIQGVTTLDRDEDVGFGRYLPVNDNFNEGNVSEGMEQEDRADDDPLNAAGEIAADPQVLPVTLIVRPNLSYGNPNGLTPVVGWANYPEILNIFGIHPAAGTDEFEFLIKDIYYFGYPVYRGMSEYYTSVCPIPPGTCVPRADWDIVVEGEVAEEPGGHAMDLELAVLFGTTKVAWDYATLSIIQADIDVDSDNSSTSSPFSPGPANNLVEDSIEDSLVRPGRYVGVNDDDDDGDNLADFWDGYNLFGAFFTHDDANISENDFYSMRFKLSGLVMYGHDVGETKVQVHYSTAPPYTPTSDGQIRIWKSDFFTRSGLSMDDGGDYIDPCGLGEYHAAAQFGISGETREVMLYIEGITPSDSLGSTRIDFMVDPDGDGESGPEGYILQDALRLTVVRVDADVDSDNTNNTPPYGPDDTLTDYEDPIEQNTGMPGRFVMANNDDDDHDGLVDHQDNDNNQEHDFVLLKVKLEPASLNPAPGRASLKINYVASSPDPGVPGNGKLRLWKRPGNETRSPVGALSGGDWIAPGEYHDLSKLTEDGNPSLDFDFYIEGVSASAAMGDIPITFELDPDGTGTEGPAGWVHHDTVRVTVHAVDLDIDSDNNNGTTAPGRSQWEESIEDAAGSLDTPGKFVEANVDDDDDDCVPDFADGFNLDNVTTNADDGCGGAAFVPIFLEIPPPLSIGDTWIKINYEASNPVDVQRVGAEPNYAYQPPDSGHLRIWLKDGGSSPPRKKASLKANPPGDYIEPGIYEDLTKLGFSEETRSKMFFLEGIVPSTSYADLRVTIELDPDGQAGPAGWFLADAIRTTVVRADINIDSDNNEHIEEYDDPIEAKTPGCVIPKDLAGDTDEGAAEVIDSLKAINLKVEPVLPNGKITLSAEEGVKIWLEEAKTTEVALPKTYDPPSSAPATLYVDGISKKKRPNIVLKYEHKDALQIASDTVKVLVTETPSWAPHKGPSAHVWSSLPTLGVGDGRVFEDEIKDQGFDDVVGGWLEDSTGSGDIDFRSCTLGNYKSLPNSGAFYVISHGGPSAHYAVYAADNPAGQAACDAWRAGEVGMAAEYWRGDCYTVQVSSNWLSTNFKPDTEANKTITFWGICHSADISGGTAVKEAAGGRWRIGYTNPTDVVECTTVNERFLRRMNGKTDDNERRPAGEAYESKSGYPANVEMDGNKWTTLCPAPVHEDDFPVFPDIDPGKRFGWGCIIFDTYMDDSITASEALIKVTGGPTYDFRWAGNTNGKFMLGFDYDNTADLATTMRAVATKCKNKDATPDKGRQLDGDRLTPNKDNKDWNY